MYTILFRGLAAAGPERGVCGPGFGHKGGPAPLPRSLLAGFVLSRVCTYLCISVSLYLCISVSLYLCISVSLYLCISVSLYLHLSLSLISFCDTYKHNISIIYRVLNYGVRVPVSYGNLREQTGEHGFPQALTETLFCSYRNLRASQETFGKLQDHARNPVLQLPVTMDSLLVSNLVCFVPRRATCDDSHCSAS